MSCSLRSGFGSSLVNGSAKIDGSGSGGHDRLDRGFNWVGSLVEIGSCSGRVWVEDCPVFEVVRSEVEVVASDDS